MLTISSRWLCSCSPCCCSPWWTPPVMPPPFPFSGSKISYIANDGDEDYVSPQPFCINLTNGVKFRLTEVHRFYLKPEWLDLTTRHPVRSADDHLLLEVVYENWIPSRGVCRNRHFQILGSTIVKILLVDFIWCTETRVILDSQK